MKQIAGASALVYGLRKEQKKNKNVTWQQSIYCISADCPEGTLLYHTLSGEMVLLPADEKETEINEELIRKWFLVPQEYDEYRVAADIRKIAVMTRQTGTNKTEFTILTTTDCNARCFYCYEKGIARTTMTDETALAAAEYIARVSGGEKILLRWFGGEPLYNRKAIDLICNALAKKKINFESTMITNGYYLDFETADHAVKSWKLKKVQITVDGTEEKYNRIKAYIDKDDNNPFRRVMNHIQAAMDAGIRVTIRLNMDAANAADLKILAGYLADRFQNHENLDVYVALLQEFSGKISAYESQEKQGQDYLTVREILKQNGLLRKKKLPSSLRQFRCMADSDTSETILPDGRTGRCEHYSEAMITGSIYNDCRDEAVIQKWKEALSMPECTQCALYPRCGKLAMCEWNRNGCTDMERKIGVMEIREQMLEKYTEWKEKENGL